jgi:hypothetical protein
MSEATSGIIIFTLNPHIAALMRATCRLGREEKAGRTYSDAQREWLVAIRGHLSVHIEIRPEDMMDAPDFFARRRRGALFGVRLPARSMS